MNMQLDYNAMFLGMAITYCAIAVWLYNLFWVINYKSYDPLTGKERTKRT